MINLELWEDKFPIETWRESQDIKDHPQLRVMYQNGEADPSFVVRPIDTFDSDKTPMTILRNVDDAFGLVRENGVPVVAVSYADRDGIPWIVADYIKGETIQESSFTKTTEVIRHVKNRGDIVTGIARTLTDAFDSVSPYPGDLHHWDQYICDTDRQAVVIDVDNRLLKTGHTPYYAGVAKRRILEMCDEAEEQGASMRLARLKVKWLLRWAEEQ